MGLMVDLDDLDLNQNIDIDDNLMQKLMNLKLMMMTIMDPMDLMAFGVAVGVDVYDEDLRDLHYVVACILNLD